MNETTHQPVLAEGDMPDAPAEAAADAAEDRTTAESTADDSKQEAGSETDAMPLSEQHEPDSELEPTSVTRRRRGYQLTLAVLATATVAIIAAGVAFGLEVVRNAADEQRHLTALQAARQHTLNLITLDPGNVDQRTKALLDGSTGEFRRQFEGAAPTFAEVVRQGQVRSAGSIDEAGVQRLDEHQARVLVAASAKVSNTQAQEPEPRRYRMTVDLTYENDRWLISKMEFVP